MWARTRHHQALAAILIALLVLAAFPVARVRAQAGLPPEEQGLLDRVLTGLDAVSHYTSYQAVLRSDWLQDWTGSLNGQVVQGSRAGITQETQEWATVGSPGPNIRQTKAISQVVMSLDGTTQDTYLQGETRVVNGATYVNAAYISPSTDLLALPDGWYRLTGVHSLDVWPGLQMMLSPAQASGYTGTDVNYYLLGQKTDDLKAALIAFATHVTFQATTLDDGTPVEAITVTLSRDAAQAMGMSFDPNDPVTRLLLRSITGDPLTATLYFNAEGQVVGQDATFAIKVEDLDISIVSDAPPGFKLNLTLTQSMALRFMAVNTPQERIQAPEVKALAALPAFEVPVSTGPLPWWNDRVFYEIFVRSFYDSNGDGIGDLRGVIDRLDYLNDGDPATSTDLGVTGIWLMPIMESPSYHGYDVIDYYTVNADYGTNQDFRNLVQEAHKRGIAVIVDLVMNHTSNQHPWFVASSQGDPTFNDWYVWSDTDPGYRRPDNGAPVWYASGDRYYYAFFWDGMPDLNYTNPAVTHEMDRVIRYWLTDMGADGFRLDAVKHLIEAGPVLENTPATLTWLQGFHSLVRSINPDALTVGEIWDSSDTIRQYVGDKVDIAFEFSFAQAVLNAAQWQIAEPLILAEDTVVVTYPPQQYATFLTNHDQNRVMSQLSGDVGAARVVATILMTSPGVPFIYYGEEIGMTGTKPDERIRTPLPWDGTRVTAGFTMGVPWEILGTGYSTVNIASQTDDPGSLLSHYRRLIHLRNEHPALRTGSIQLVDAGYPAVYSFLRYADDEALLVVVNLSAETVTSYGLTVAQGLLTGELTVSLLLGDGYVTPPVLTDSGGFTDYKPLASLPPQSSFVIRLQ
ncbi:MAG TPA: alpha-amylase family glycosyl hydrolase [Aggregatilineaceae bacterium]|nr:alpha-amylase family glycosyl hydrolase [Aggregatilineaceae bacterium]